MIEASAKYLRMSPRKVRVVSKSVVGLKVGQAISLLGSLNKKPAHFIVKVLKQAMANAKNNQKIAEAEKLRIARIEVQDGPRMKRMDKSHSARFDRGIIKKRFCHILVVLEQEETQKQQPKRSKNGQ